MTTPQQAYDELLKISHELALLNSIDAILGWDQEVNMPPKGAPWRAEQASYLSGTVHRKFTDPRVGDLLATAEAGDFGTDSLSDEAVNLREWRHDYDRQTKVPTELVEELTHTAVMAQGHWAEARKKAEFSLFAPDLKKIIGLVRQKAEYIGYEETPYDALLGGFEPGEKTANVQRIFAALRDDLVPLVQAIAESSKQARTEILHREYPADRQRILGEGASAAIGLDFTASRLDVSTHPFSTNFGPGDQRITTRYNTRFFNESFFGTMHETGHALYEQNLPQEAFGTPRGDSVSLGIHESQSRTWENFVGRSRAFWQFYYPRTQQMFPAVLSDVSMEDFYFAVNEVKPSYIRVEADEITYNLHIMLRFEIEQAIISGDLQVDDIPGAWNELFEDYVGIKVPDDGQGCLQDIHWAFGGFGYFSTYALGNLYGAQFFAKAREDMPNLDELIAAGEFKPLLDWLRTNVYSQGMRYRSGDLVQHVTGKPLSHKPLVAYLQTKFGELYDL